MGNEKNIMKMLGICQKIQTYTAGVDYQKFVASTEITELCVFNLLQLGEFGSRLDAAFKVEHKNIPWNKIRGFRNRLVHDYENVDLAVVWDVIENDVPALADALERVVIQFAKSTGGAGK